jgi:hypothetical protein
MSLFIGSPSPFTGSVSLFTGSVTPFTGYFVDAATAFAFGGNP